MSASDPIELIRRCKALESRCVRLEQRSASLEGELMAIADQLAAASSAIDAKLVAIINRMGVCGKTNVDTGSICGLPAGHKAAIHSSDRLPRQGEPT